MSEVSPFVLFAGPLGSSPQMACLEQQSKHPTQAPASASAPLVLEIGQGEIGQVEMPVTCLNSSELHSVGNCASVCSNKEAHLHAAAAERSDCLACLYTLHLSMAWLQAPA